MPYRYRFNGPQAEELAGLSGALTPTRGSALVEPGDEVELPDPVVYAWLDPIDDATVEATAALAAHEDALSAADAAGASGDPETVNDPEAKPRRRSRATTTNDADPGDETAGSAGEEG